jgi:hypothetical protein
VRKHLGEGSWFNELKSRFVKQNQLKGQKSSVLSDYAAYATEVANDAIKSKVE